MYKAIEFIKPEKNIHLEYYQLCQTAYQVSIEFFGYKILIHEHEVTIYQ